MKLKFKVSLTVIQRIVGGFALLMLLMLFGNVSSYLKLDEIKAQLFQVTERANPLVLNANQQIIYLLEANKAVVEAVAADNIKKLEAIESNYSKMLRQYRALDQELSDELKELPHLKTVKETIDTEARKFFVEAEKTLQLNRQAREKTSQIEQMRIKFEVTTDQIQNGVKDMLLTMDDEYVRQLVEVFRDIFLLSEKYTISALNSTNLGLIQRVSADNAIKVKELQSAYEQFIAEIPDKKPDWDPIVTQFTRDIDGDAAGGVLSEHKKQMGLAAEARKNMQVSTGFVNEAIASLQSLVQAARSIAQLANTQAVSAVSDGRNTSVIVSIISLLLAALIAWRVALSIKRPLDRIVHMLKLIASGDMTQRIEIQSRDELGMLAGWVNDLAAQLREMIHELAQGAISLSASAVQALQISEQSAESIRQQRDETEKVSSAMQAMDDSVQEVSRSVSTTLGEIVSADDATQQSKNIVLQNARTINELSSRVEQSSQVIHQLEIYSTKIGSILDVIRGIADQTNLLALNAAIEAARAGEHGRGFAVVADEVRTLASRTKTSTKEIQQMIENLQSGTADGVKVMGQVRNEMKRSVEFADKASISLEQISKVILTIRDMSTSIASAAEQQHITTHEIAQNVERISGIAEENSIAVSETAKNSEMLEQLALRQQELISKFRT